MSPPWKSGKRIRISAVPKSNQHRDGETRRTIPAPPPPLPRPPPPQPPLPLHPPPPPPPTRKLESVAAGGGGGGRCREHSVCGGGPCRHYFGGASRSPDDGGGGGGRRRLERRTVIKHRRVTAVLSVGRTGYTITNGNTTVCVQGSSGSNSELARDVCEMGVTELVLPNRYSEYRWKDVMASAGRYMECFSRNFEFRLLKKKKKERRKTRTTSTPAASEKAEDLSRRLVDRSCCRDCGKTTCHIFNAIPTATDRVFPNKEFERIRH